MDDPVERDVGGDRAVHVGLGAAGGGALRWLSPDDTYIYEYAWTPDGEGFVATGAKGNGDSNWWVARLGHVDAASAAPALQMNFPIATAVARYTPSDCNAAKLRIFRRSG